MIIWWYGHMIIFHMTVLIANRIRTNPTNHMSPSSKIERIKIAIRHKIKMGIKIQTNETAIKNSRTLLDHVAGRTGAPGDQKKGVNIFISILFFNNFYHINFNSRQKSTVFRWKKKHFVQIFDYLVVQFCGNCSNLDNCLHKKFISRVRA